MGKIKDAAGTALNAVKTLKFWQELFVMTFGMAIAALAVNYFLVPGKLIVGSISGLSIVISGIFDLMRMTVKVSTVILIFLSPTYWPTAAHRSWVTSGWICAVLYFC